MEKRLIVFIMLLAVILTGCADKTQKTAPQPSEAPKAEAHETVVESSKPSQKLTGEKADLEAILFETPNSTCFSRIGYYESGKLLIVEFRDSGSIYEYSKFSTEDWENFSSADSLGGYYNEHIKGNYPCERIY